jgi:hypothetical protein
MTPSKPPKNEHGAPMPHSKHRISRSSRILRRLGGVLGLVLVAGSLTTASAWGSYEQVANFANSGEGMQLYGVNGLAVNTTGAGGVPAGTVYAAGARNIVARFDPDGTFSEGWGWNVSIGGKKQFERCGPDGEAAHPVCKAGQLGNAGSFGEGAGQHHVPIGVAVHQATGNVYVLNTPATQDPNSPLQREHDVIEVFSADGSQIVTSFGDAGASTETFDEGPEKLHRVSRSGIAVDESGVVYVTDTVKDPKINSPVAARVMVFKPQIPGDYKQYVYAGRANDIEVGAENAGGSLALDSDGDLFTLVGEREIYEFDLGEPDTPTCEFHLAAGGIYGLTVNPASGEPFYFSTKTKKIHQLSACNAEGKFVEKSSIPMTPKTDGNVGLAYNPNLPFSPARPAGTLYAGSDEGPFPGEIYGMGYIFAAPEVFPPSVESEAVSSVTSSTAVLSAQINPKGSETRYAFQYLTAAEYEANEPGDRFAGGSEVPLGGGVLEPAQKPLSGATAVAGLLPDTAYRYRVIATSHCEPENEAAVCEDTGADATFRTFPVEAPGLPDSRAYEQVSPALKNGGEVFPLVPERASCGASCMPGVAVQKFPRQASPDGEAVVYEGQPFSLTEGAAVLNQYLSKRTRTGWQTTILAPRLMGSNLQGYRAFDTELTTGVLLQVKPSLTPEAPSETTNLYIQPTADPSALTALLGAEPPNRGHDVKLAYAGASADLSRRFFAANDALTGSTAFAPEALDGGSTKNNLYESVGGELRLVNVLPGNETVPGAYFGARPVETSGNKNSVSNLFHAISEDGSRVFWTDEAGQVYVRENGETTTEVPDPGKFLSATADGSKVLLRNGHLYDLETEALADLTEGQGGFEGIVGQSEDLSRIYFVDTAVLTGEEENDYGAKAEAGKYNLYSWQGASATFLTVLDVKDSNHFGGGDWHFSPAQRTAQASPNGRWVTFLSRAPLTGHDNVGPKCGLDNSGGLIAGPCFEVFLYDSATAELSCPSCNPSQQAPLGHSGLPLMLQNPGAEDPVPHVRYLTDDGRLYFDSRDSLNPFDTNNGVEDAYQYEPQGVGGCKRDGGCVNLISAGTGIGDSNFLAVDATGKNVFFTTRDQLLLRDRDELIDLYVAREGGGIPAETETGRGECQGEACLPAVAPPNDPTPGSLSFQGAGNVDEQKASKKQKKKKKRAKKRGAKKHKKHNRAAKQNRGGAR